MTDLYNCENYFLQKLAESTKKYKLKEDCFDFIFQMGMSVFKIMAFTYASIFGTSEKMEIFQSLDRPNYKNSIIYIFGYL